MGFSRGTEIFNNVAVKIETLVGLARLEENDAQSILESMINGLQTADWDTQDESLVEFKTTPFIVQAFKNCGILLCDEE